MANPVYTAFSKDGHEVMFYYFMDFQNWQISFEIVSEQHTRHEKRDPNIISKVYSPVLTANQRPLAFVREYGNQNSDSIPKGLTNISIVAFAVNLCSHGLPTGYIHQRLDYNEGVISRPCFWTGNIFWKMSCASVRMIWCTERRWAIISNILCCD